VTGNVVYTWEPCAWPTDEDGAIGTTSVHAVDVALRDQGWHVIRHRDPTADDNYVGDCTLASFKKMARPQNLWVRRGLLQYSGPTKLVV